MQVLIIEVKRVPGERWKPYCEEDGTPVLVFTEEFAANAHKVLAALEKGKPKPTDPPGIQYRIKEYERKG